MTATAHPSLARSHRVLAALEARGLLPLLCDVCVARGVTEVEIASSVRTRAVVRARHELWWRIRGDPSHHFSFLEIARLFCCDHSSVCHGVHAHERRIQP